VKHNPNKPPPSGKRGKTKRVSGKGRKNVDLQKLLYYKENGSFQEKLLL